jgi:hypothetical protein
MNQFLMHLFDFRTCVEEKLYWVTSLWSMVLILVKCLKFCKLYWYVILPAQTAVKTFLSQESLRMVYFSYFHSIMTYGLVFWDKPYHSNTVLKLQKRIIRIMVGIRDRESCREYFRKLKILPLQSQYVYLLLLFVINTRQHFKILNKFWYT